MKNQMGGKQWYRNGIRVLHLQMEKAAYLRIYPCILFVRILQYTQYSSSKKIET